MSELWGTARECAGLPAAGRAAEEGLPLHSVREAARYDRGRRPRRCRSVPDVEPRAAAARRAEQLLPGFERGCPAGGYARARSLGGGDTPGGFWGLLPSP